MALSPEQTAEALNLSVSNLRRISGLYETVFGPITVVSDRNGRPGRSYNDQVIKRIEQARQLTKEGKATGWTHAFKTLASIEQGGMNPDDTDLALVAIRPEQSNIMLDQLAQEVRLLRSAQTLDTTPLINSLVKANEQLLTEIQDQVLGEIKALRSEVRGLRDANRELREMVKPRWWEFWRKT